MRCSGNSLIRQLSIAAAVVIVVVVVMAVAVTLYTQLKHSGGALVAFVLTRNKRIIMRRLVRVCII